MADQQRWFKLWCSAPFDDDLQALSPAHRWAWAALGCYTKEHGTNGVIKISASNRALVAAMGIDLELLHETMKLLPHIHVEEGRSDNDEFIVTWNNWHKYQVDSTSYERVKNYRKRQKCNDLRGEEKRRDKEEKRIPPISPMKGDFDSFWREYPRKVGKGAARAAWKKLDHTDGLDQKILAAVVAQKGWKAWREGFIPLPATWLNQTRWEDEGLEILKKKDPFEMRHG